MDIEKLVEVLKSPSIYPDAPKEVRVSETHISYLFFTGNYVYKVKKSVSFGFLDFTTLEKRRFFCNEEVRLNSRLSPDIYLGVVEIREKDGVISLDGEGTTVEFAVKMTEMPSDGMLDRLIAEGRATPELMAGIGGKIARFHKEAETNDRISSFGDISVIKRNVQENFIQTVHFIGKSISREQYDFISERSMEFIDKNKLLFARRKKEERIRDCHGDLHAGAICVEGGSIHVFDCIEFNDRFRYSDTAADIAFLAMDIESYGCFDLSAALVDSYINASGDADLSIILRFYKSYRAYVRGKVMSFMLDEDEVPDDEKKAALSKARHYFGLAYSYLMQPTLIIMSGLTGTGKSAVAARIGEAIGARVVRSDVVRKRLAGIPLDEHRYEGFGKGIYTAAFSEQTYAELHREAAESLRAGRPVILDAAYLKRAERERAAALAMDSGARFFMVECVCDEKTVRERLTDRMEKQDVSDGRWEIYEAQRRVLEETTENEGRLIRVDSARPVEESAELVLRIVGR